MCDKGPLCREGAPLMLSGAFAIALTVSCCAHRDVDAYQNKVPTNPSASP